MCRAALPVRPDCRTPGSDAGPAPAGPDGGGGQRKPGVPPPCGNVLRCGGRGGRGAGLPGGPGGRRTAAGPPRPGCDHRPPAGAVRGCPEDRPDQRSPGPGAAEVRTLPSGRRGTPAQHSQGGAGDRRRRGTDNRLPVRPLPADCQRRDGADRRGTRRCQRRGRAGRLRGGLPARPEAAQPGHRGPQGTDKLPGTGHGAGPDAAGQHQSRLPGPGGQGPGSPSSRPRWPSRWPTTT